MFRFGASENAMAEKDRIVAIRVTGSVQGVGFRVFVQHEAERLGVNGFVRNRCNGDVEALFAGEAAAVAALVSACRCGPAPARVAHLAVYEPEPDMLAELPPDGFRRLADL
jgi:acylphosphatase